MNLIYCHIDFRLRCKSIKDIGDCEEKDSAFRGMCKMITASQSGIIHDDFVFLCDALASWDNPGSDIKEQFVKVLNPLS